MARSQEPEKSVKQEQRKPMHGTLPGDRISGDRLVVQCRKPGKWESFRMSDQHNGFCTTARKNAIATVEAGYTNVRSG